jgi:hypothetical protein
MRSPEFVEQIPEAEEAANEAGGKAKSEPHRLPHEKTRTRMIRAGIVSVQIIFEPYTNLS